MRSRSWEHSGVPQSPEARSQKRERELMGRAGRTDFCTRQRVILPQTEAAAMLRKLQVLITALIRVTFTKLQHFILHLTLPLRQEVEKYLP